MEPVNRPAPVDIDTFVFGGNDSENAKIFVNDRFKWVRFVPEWACWILRDAKTNTWIKDDGEGTQILWLAQRWAASKHAQALSLEANSEEETKKKSLILKWTNSLGNSDRLSSMLRMARGNPKIAAPVAQIDCDPWLIGTLSGVLDLRTRAIVEPEDCFVTRCVNVPFDTEATCPRWEQFLSEIMEGNEEMVGYLRRALGYSLAGVQNEKVMFFLYGGGDNGKSLFVNTAYRIFGAGTGYAVKFGKRLLAEGRVKEPPYQEIAELHGKRFALGSEVAEDERLNEDVVKDITGGDPLTGRRLYEHPFTFDPQCTVWLYGNHKPIVRGADTAIWKRLRCIPFNRHFTNEEQDRDLGNKLAAEAVGIFRWMVEACAEWQREGLGSPEEVRATVEEYRADSDEMGMFMEEVLEITGDEKGDRVSYLDIYEQFRQWNEAQGGRHTPTRVKFVRKLKERLKKEGRVREYDHAGGRGVRGLCGVRIREIG